MIIENIVLANKRTRATLVKPCMYIIASCVLARKYGSYAHSRSSFQTFRIRGIMGTTTTTRIPKLMDKGNDEE